MTVNFSTGIRLKREMHGLSPSNSVQICVDYYRWFSFLDEVFCSKSFRLECDTVCGGIAPKMYLFNF